MTPEPTDCLLGDDIQSIPTELRIMFSTMLLFRSIEARMDEMNLDDQPMSKSERHMLVHLGVPRRMGQMAEDLYTLPSAVTAIADSLEARGLLLRERDPEDRRAWQLRLTPDGEEARHRLIDKTGALFREITGLDQADIDRFGELAVKVSTNILKTGLPKGLTL
ncbi:MarR family transcriptional regulator [Aliiruegeria haliotis]|uniref:MarR family transcriptional regulator n=1 Tax=Aliiruegeria haliotis TaxID=1280846 RepID=A0A2T0RYB2_9RHOB|nr:MarR family winged helix-turn-helix transcriptional regulator [Aliiruegeria haliotis]PRY26161.1 MarR family transcriptional regulator [Aliiruegeria haliotis]